MIVYREIENSFKRIEEQFSKRDWERFLACDYENLCLYHYTLGGWIRKEFLEQGSKLRELFIQAGIPETDDMSMIIIELFYLYAKTERTNIKRRKGEDMLK